jgi:isocitrate dehydrogenase
MDLVIVRENEEDLYAGIEHRQTNQVAQTLKLISRPGTERIMKFAFEYARTNGRKSVTCFSKDNIMKMTDGLFHKIFDEVAPEYPEITSDHYIIDIGSAKLATDPNRFEVIVTANLYGDVISDIAAEMTGSVGLGGSANLGQNYAMFEAVHGSAPDIAGKGIANPSGMLLGAVLMLKHLGMPRQAELIHNAWLCALEEGVHTGDIFREGTSTQKVGTEGFTKAVIERFGKKPQKLKSVTYADDFKPIKVEISDKPAPKKEMVGVDAFLEWRHQKPRELGDALTKVAESPLELVMITNRGIEVYPASLPDIFCTDHWRCRFLGDAGKVSNNDLLALLKNLADSGFEVIKTENLYLWDGEPGFSHGKK